MILDILYREKIGRGFFNHNLKLIWLPSISLKIETAADSPAAVAIFYENKTLADLCDDRISVAMATAQTMHRESLSGDIIKGQDVDYGSYRVADFTQPSAIL